MKQTSKNDKSTILRGWIGSFLVALLVATSIKSAIADWYVVPTGSMKPTILEGDRIFTNKLAYDLKLPYTTLHLATWDDPRRGDIVVFNAPNEKKRLVKRVVGIPGDVVAMTNNQLYVNGEAMAYDPVPPRDLERLGAAQTGWQTVYIENLTGHRHQTMITPGQPSIRSFPPMEVPANHYFMMGDNRDNSADSRYFGFIDRDRILGRATYIVISMDILDHYRPRWSRFFSRLR
jgi:signal peptidase I